MRGTCWLVFGAVWLAPAAARADWIVGVRSGYAFALGDRNASAPMSDLVPGQIPIQLDLGHRFGKLTVGAYGSYGFGPVSGAAKTSCHDPGRECASTSLRVGGQAAYAFARPLEPMSPWIGLGAGYESITLEPETVSGIEWLVLQGGFDWRFGTGGSMGAFASLSFGTYTNIEGGGRSGALVDRRVHEWVTLGLRGTFAFGS